MLEIPYNQRFKRFNHFNRFNPFKPLAGQPRAAQSFLQECWSTKAKTVKTVRALKTFERMEYPAQEL